MKRTIRCRIYTYTQNNITNELIQKVVKLKIKSTVTHSQASLKLHKSNILKSVEIEIFYKLL